MNVGQWLIRASIAIVCALLAVMYHTQAPLIALRCPPSDSQEASYNNPEGCAPGPQLIIRSVSDLWLGTGRFIDDYRENINAASTFAIAIFTLTLWWTTRKLWQAHRETLAHAKRIQEEEFVAAHPPTVRIKYLWLNSEVWHGEEIAIDVLVTNKGKTYAQISTCNIAILVHDTGRDLPSWPQIEKVGDNKRFGVTPDPFYLHAGQTLSLPQFPTGKILTEEENAAIRDGTKRLYIVGNILYSDRAGRVRV